MEPVFRALELTAQVAVTATGTQITFRGVEHLPATGGSVVAINHTGYLDWLPAALAAGASPGSGSPLAGFVETDIGETMKGANAWA